MLQEKMLSATSRSEATPDLGVTSLDLSYDPGTGTFTLGSQTGPITAGFQIPLSGPGKIHIHASSEIQLIANNPLGWLPTNTTINPTVTAFSSDSIEIDVQNLPPEDRAVGFLLTVNYVGESGTVNGIETPTIFITQSSFAALSFMLSYDPTSGDFVFNNDDAMPISVEKGVALLRLGTSASNNQGPTTTVTLGDSSGEIQFVSPYAIFTPGDGAILTFTSPSAVQFSRDFADGGGVGVSFVIQVASAGATVCSPDPIIIDKQIGTGGDDGPVS